MRIPFALVALLIDAAITSAAQLQEVASFPDKQITGVGVSAKSGRIFVNFPYWSDDHSISVAEIVNGQPKAFPDDEWNKRGPAASHFVCVQSAMVDDKDNLWVLDPAAPKMQEIVKGGPKLVKIDLATNQVVQTILFGEEVAPKKSHLNDVRIDTRTNTAFITESGRGVIVVVDLKSGKARRLLDGHASTQPEKDIKLIVDGKTLIDQQRKRRPRSHPTASRWMQRTGSLLSRAHWSHPLPDQNELSQRRETRETGAGIEGRKCRPDAGARWDARRAGWQRLSYRS